jgi:acetylornithine deacetylase
LQIERRTTIGESGESAHEELTVILEALKREDPEFEGMATLTFARPPYELPSDHALPMSLRAAAVASGCRSETTGMTFWTDAAVLAGAGVPSVLFGPGGAGLHSREEYVNVADVLSCRDVLRRLVVEWC